MHAKDTMRLALVVLCMVILNHARAYEGHVGLIKGVRGNVTLTRQNATLTVAPGMAVQVEDRLRSAPGSAAGIVFKDGTLLTLGDSADLTVRDYLFQPAKARYAFFIYLDKGTALYVSGKIGKLAPEQVKVDTPSATIGVRGTRFLILAD